MKYEQEKNKINKLWEKSQNNTNELSKKENDSLKTSPNNFFKKAKNLISPEWIIIVPYYQFKGKYDSLTFPVSGGTYWIMNLQIIRFSSQYIHLQIYRSGSLIFDKRIIGIYEEFVGYYYEFTLEEFEEIDFDSSFTWRMRLWEESANRFHNWSDLKPFYTYEYFEPPIPRSDVYLFSFGHLSTFGTYTFPPRFISHYFGTPYPSYAYLMYGTKNYGFNFNNNKGEWTEEISTGDSEAIIEPNDMVYTTVSTSSSGISINSGSSGGGNLWIWGGTVFEPTYHNIKFKVQQFVSGIGNGWIRIEVGNYYMSPKIYDSGYHDMTTYESAEIDATGWSNLFIRVTIHISDSTNINVKIDLPITYYVPGGLSENVSLYLIS